MSAPLSSSLVPTNRDSNQEPSSAQHITRSVLRPIRAHRSLPRQNPARGTLPHPIRDHGLPPQPIKMSSAQRPRLPLPNPRDPLGWSQRVTTKHPLHLPHLHGNRKRLSQWLALALQTSPAMTQSPVPPASLNTHIPPPPLTPPPPPPLHSSAQLPRTSRLANGSLSLEPQAEPQSLCQGQLTKWNLPDGAAEPAAVTVEPGRRRREGCC